MTGLPIQLLSFVRLPTRIDARFLWKNINRLIPGTS